jgi:hypothetical protein
MRGLYPRDHGEPIGPNEPALSQRGDRENPRLVLEALPVFAVASFIAIATGVSALTGALDNLFALGRPAVPICAGYAAVALAAQLPLIAKQRLMPTPEWVTRVKPVTLGSVGILLISGGIAWHTWFPPAPPTPPPPAPLARQLATALTVAGYNTVVCSTQACAGEVPDHMTNFHGLGVELKFSGKPFNDPLALPGHVGRWRSVLLVATPGSTQSVRAIHDIAVAKAKGAFRTGFKHGALSGCLGGKCYYARQFRDELVWLWTYHARRCKTACALNHQAALSIVARAVQQVES